MRPTLINSAEAIFAPFFDERISDLAEWTTDTPGTNGFRLIQGWSFVTLNWTLPATDGLVLRLHRRYAAFDCSAYDRVLACFNLPEDCIISIHAETDAGPRTRSGEPTGSIRREEWLDLAGARQILALTVEVHSPKRTPGSGWIQWFGLQHTGRLAHHLAQWAGYDEHWDKYLQPPEFEPSFKPAYGLMIDEAELAAVRTAFPEPHATAELRYVAEAARRVLPESLIGENVNFWSSNIHRRERDIGKMITLHGSAAAQAGVLWRDKALCRLAARFALSLALCEHWEDIFFAHMRGCTWDQRGFVQSMGMWDCAIILDLCGEWFTPLGRDVVLRKMATAGHGGLCHASWWYEYMYHTNQLAWISPARIYGLLVLEKTMPGRLGDFPRPPSRVAPHTDQAWANLQENLDHCLLADGSYLEGPMYFTWVARQAAFGALLYARGRGQAARDLVSPALLRTQRYAEMLLSTDEQQDMIMICDATFVPGEGLAFLAWLMPDSHWVTIFRKSFRRVGTAPLLVTLNLARNLPEHGPALSPFIDLPESGLMCSVRRLGPEAVKLFVMGNKADGGHQHEDKGNFVLECAGDSFAMDFGVMDYANPVSNLMQHAQRHNVLTPWCDTERPHPANPIPVDIRPRGHGDATAFHATMDLETGWEAWFSRRQRRWDSPASDRLVITDEWALATDRAEGVVFHWTTPLPVRVADGRVIIEGRRAWAELSFPADCLIELVPEPLLDPRRAAVEADRRDIVQFGLHRAETQPVLRVRQRGRAGTFRTEVRLHLRPAL